MLLSRLLKIDEGFGLYNMMTIRQGCSIPGLDLILRCIFAILSQLGVGADVVVLG